jgi:hypothetical protein
MTEDQFSKLDFKWSSSLGPLAYFHMSEGHHTKYPEVYETLLDCITPTYVTAGFHAAVNERIYNELTGVKINGQTLRYWFGGAYSFCVNAYMMLVGEWLTKYLPEEQNVAYFLDTGHPRFGEADMFLNMISSDENFLHTKMNYRMVSHTFVDGKTKSGQILQSADIIAWHFNYMMFHGDMLPEGKKITRAVKCFYRYYIDTRSIFEAVDKTLDMEKRLMEQRVSRRRQN